MSGAGTTTVNFGAWGSNTSDAQTVVTGQAGIVSGSLVEAWVIPTATADHSADEHVLEKIRVYAGNNVAGTGFTIYAIDDNQLSEPPAPKNAGSQPRIYGLFTVGWVWV